MRAKLTRWYRDMTVGKVYDVTRASRGEYFMTRDDVGDVRTIEIPSFEVLHDEPSEEPAATTDVVDRPELKPGDKVRLREFAYGTTLKAGASYGSTMIVREVLKATTVDGRQTVFVHPSCGGELSALWFDLVEPWNPAKAPAPHGTDPAIRTFETGASRNLDNSKNDYEGFISPLVVEAFGTYMHSHRLQKDGTMRASDNWQKGIPFDVYMKSGWRHFFDWWKLHRGFEAKSPEDGHDIDKVEALCALMFNVQGYMHELLKERSNGD